MKEVTKEEKRNEEKNINSRETKKKSQENTHLERKKIGIDGRRRNRETERKNRGVSE